jgi:hypothetical protein
MNSHNAPFEDEDLIRLARAVHDLDVQEAPRQHSQRTPQCPPLTRFGVAGTTGWSPDEQAHISSCPYCQKVLGMFARDVTPRGEAPDDTAVRMGETGGGLTSLLLRDPDAFRRRLRPWLPFLLEHVGLDAGRADAFLDFVLARAHEIGSRRVRDLLPDWLRQFAGGSGRLPTLTDDDFQAVAGRGAVALVLDRAGADKSAWARDFCAFARGRSLRSPQELRTLDVAGLAVDPYDLQVFRRTLAAEAEQLQQAELSFLLN